MVATYYSTGQDNNIYYNTYLNATWYTGWTGWKRVIPRIITFSPTVTLSSDYGIATVDISDRVSSNIEGIICISPIYHSEQSQYNFQYGILNRTRFNIICREAKGLTFSPNIMVVLGSY